MGRGARGSEGTVAVDRVSERGRVAQAHLELPVDAEAKALVPDGIPAVLHCACLQPVAGGRGQPQSHIAVRGGHCGKKARAPVTARPPEAPSLRRRRPRKTQRPKEQGRVGGRKSRGRAPTVTSLQSSLSTLARTPLHTRPCSHLFALPLPTSACHATLYHAPGSTHLGLWRAGHGPGAHEW